ncbi:HU family DNA-binding protein, partial [Bacillus subtilis]
LNLSKLIHEVWKDERTRGLGLRKEQVKILAEVFIDHIGKGLLEHGVLKLQNLFTLKIREAKGRRIKNPQTGKHMYSKDYHKIAVKPSKKIKDGLKRYKK